MRRGSLAVFSMALVVLAFAGAAGAAPGGLGPPAPQTDSGETISHLYWAVFTVCAIVFVAVESALVLFIIRFRRRRGTPETAEGPQIHGNTRLEVIWTIIPAVILAAIAVLTLTRIPATSSGSRSRPTSSTGSTTTPMERSPSTSSAFPSEGRSRSRSSRTTSTTAGGCPP